MDFKRPSELSSPVGLFLTTSSAGFSSGVGIGAVSCSVLSDDVSSSFVNISFILSINEGLSVVGSSFSIGFISVAFSVVSSFLIVGGISSSFGCSLASSSFVKKSPILSIKDESSCSSSFWVASFDFSSSTLGSFVSLGTVSTGSWFSIFSWSGAFWMSSFSFVSASSFLIVSSSEEFSASWFSLFSVLFMYWLCVLFSVVEVDE